MRFWQRKREGTRYNACNLYTRKDGGYVYAGRFDNYDSALYAAALLGYEMEQKDFAFIVVPCGAIVLE